MDGPPPPPGAEPSSKKPPAVPPVACGSFWSSPKDWYERHKNKHSVFEADFWKNIGGLGVLYVASVATKITLGLEHKTILGGSRSFITPFDNKFNGGFVLNYIRPVKDEETRGNKSEWILGVKISHVKGKKNEFQGTKEVKVSDITLANKTNTLNQHISALERIVASKIEEDINKLEMDYDKLERTIREWEEEYTKIDMEVNKWTHIAKNYKGDFQKLREECDTVDEKYSGTFKSLAEAAHELNVSGQLERTLNGDAKFIAGSMVQLGAAITKAG